MTAIQQNDEPMIPLFGGRRGWPLVGFLLQGTLFWGALVLVYTAALIAMGALIGLLAFVVVGTLAGMDYTLAEMAASGARNGGFFMVMWAPGIAMVICMLQARRRWERRTR
jgi:hypothetical protein